MVREMKTRGEAGEPVLRLHNVRKSFGPLQVLKGLSFEIREGQVFALLGPNGSGKTTAVRTILQTLQADRGEVAIHGLPVGRRRRDLIGRVGFMLEHASMMAELTLEQNLLVAGALYRLPDVKGAVEETIIRLDMTSWKDSPLSRFSRGMLQKASLARALMPDPDLLILDEPLSGLDPMHQEEFRHILRDLRRRRKAVLYCSHDLSEVERTSTHLGIIAGGRLAACGSLTEVLKACKWKKYRTEWATPKQAACAVELLAKLVIVREEDSAPCVVTVLVHQDCDFVSVMRGLSERELGPTRASRQVLTLSDVFYCAIAEQKRV